MTIITMNEAPETDASAPPLVKEARVWRDNGWTARVIKNEDDEGWAAKMILDVEVEPVLVSPWTMGRDKKNPKPLDPAAFNTLVKTASEFRLRQEQQLHAAHHQGVTVNVQSERVTFPKKHSAVSMPKCKKCSMMLLEIESLRGEQLGWEAEAHWLAWPSVQLPGNGIELRLGVSTQTGALGQVLSQQSIGVVVDATLPSAVRIGKVHLHTGGLGQPLVLGHFSSLIIGLRPAQGGRRLA
jgi:hypothetical protein